MSRQLNLLFSLVLLTVATSGLSGCFIFVDDNDDPAPPPAPVAVNHAPVFDGNDSWWLCEYDPYADDYYFEFQAVVDDLDGWGDVAFVDTTVFLAGDHSYVVDTFELVYEGQGVWGGLMWERESNLFCGEAVDVLYEAWDSYGELSDLLIRY